MTVPSPESDARPETRERKSRLRTDFRARRQALGSAQRARFDAAIREHLLDAVLSRGARRVGAFVAFDGEPDIAPLLPGFAEQGLVVALPVLRREDRGRSLCFHRWTPASLMESNAFGIREPRGTPTMALRELEILLMPLVAWSRDGSRLGMGAGYYDRALATVGPAGAGPLRVGVAYATQEAPALPLDPWDVPLHAVVTEAGWIDCGEAATNRASGQSRSTP